MAFSSRKEAAVLDDTPLNFNQDQQQNLDPQLRRLNLRIGLREALNFLSVPPAPLLVGGAVAALFRRRYLLASLCGAGLLLQAVAGNRDRVPARREERKELELERYAMKAQRGDYGKLQVIAFK